MAFVAAINVSALSSSSMYVPSPNSASSSSGKASSLSDKALVVPDLQALKILTKHVTLSNMFMSSYETLMVGDLEWEMLTLDNMYQVDLDDMEEMDLKWQMDMITLRLKKSEDKTGKRLFFCIKLGSINQN
ncbi:hypothetical protein Hanom_Chr11g01011731 [Helianthus anomalus]